MVISVLPDRAIVSVAGEDAEGLLNRLFTNSMLEMTPQEARYAALLSPQGKLLFDFLVYRRVDGFWIDCRRDQAGDLAKKLTMFKLRAKATVARLDDLSVAVSWGGAPVLVSGQIFRDPRHADLGFRIAGPSNELSSLPDHRAAYDAHRIALGVPEGGLDWAYGDTFVHDANLDLLNGVDFAKGCYVGQEVVSRVHHRGSARKRVVKVHFHGEPASVGAELRAANVSIGQITSLAEHEGLATVRTDRLEDAESAHAPVMAGDTLVGFTLPTSGIVALPHDTYD